MIKPARFLARADINGTQVSFFTPPHDEPDFTWVDLEELALAFLPPDKAARMVQISQTFTDGPRVVTTAINGPRIATIASHSMAQGFCGLIDHINGFRDAPGMQMIGPAHTAYCFAAAAIDADHRSMSFEEIAAAVRNNGGPFMRGFQKKGTPA